MNEKRPAIISLVHLWHMETLSQPLGPAKNKAAAIAFILLDAGLRRSPLFSDQPERQQPLICYYILRYIPTVYVYFQIYWFLYVCVCDYFFMIQVRCFHFVPYGQSFPSFHIQNMAKHVIFLFFSTETLKLVYLHKIVSQSSTHCLFYLH